MTKKTHSPAKGEDFLSEHFRLWEFTKSQSAFAFGIDNTPPKEAIEALRHLCEQVLEPLREQCGNVPIQVLSGFRCPELNRRVGGVPNSQHLYGEAADITVPNLRCLLEVLTSRDAPKFDQAIYYPGKHMVHVSFRVGKRNRCQFVVASR